MKDCCKILDALLTEVNNKFTPLLETVDPNTPLTEEQFGMMKVIMYLAETAEKLLSEESEK